MSSNDIEKLLRENKKLYAEFKKEREEELLLEEKAFEKKKESFVRKMETAIEEDHRHRMVLNLCIYPFISVNSELYKLGYRFVRANPLSELKVKNFDFLLYNYSEKKRTAIFGESKGSISRVSKTIQQTVKRKNVVESHRDYILEEYLKAGKNPVKFEYVLGAPAEKQIHVCDEIVKIGGGLIPWSAGGMNRRLLSKTLSKGLDERIRRSMMHRDKKLNVKLETGVLSDYSSYGLFPESHEVTKFRALVVVSEKLRVKVPKLMEMLREYLFYLGDDGISDLMWSTIERAIEIGILKKVDKDTYRIVSKFRQRGRVDREVRMRCINHAVEVERTKRTAIRENKVKKKYLEEYKKQKRLEEF